MPGHRLLILILTVLVLPTIAFAQGAGVTPDGEKGRLHKVVTGDTLWDITDTYLGTPWIWPSIWKENDDISNPHRIYPGDLIWITEGRMRKVTAEEAVELLAMQESGMGPSDVPAAAEGMSSGDEDLEPPDPFAALDLGSTAVERTLLYPGLHRYSFVSEDEYRASGAVLGSHNEQYWSSQGQRTIVSIGEGSAHIGDSFTIYRVRKRVRHPKTSEPLGYFVQVLGRAEIAELHPESAYALILDSYVEVEPGDRMIPYAELPMEFKQNHNNDPIDGHVIAVQPYRQYIGEGDVVILNRGVEDGVVTGREFVVYRPGKEVRDPVTTAKVLVPDDILGRIFILRSSPETAVALVRQSATEIQIGESFRQMP